MVTLPNLNKGEIDMKKVIILSIVLTAIVLVFSSCNYYSYEDSEKYDVGSGEISSKVTAIEIDWACGEVEISYMDRKSVYFEEISADGLKESERMRYYLDGTVLKIKCADKGFLKDPPSKNLDLRLPNDFVLSSLNINSDSADISVQSGSYKSSISVVNIKSDSGKVVFSNRTETIKHLDIETDSGAISTSVAAQNARLKSKSGDITYKCIKANKCEISSLDGNMDLTFNSNVESVEVENKSGNIKLQSGKLKYLEIETSNGDVEYDLRGEIEKCDITSETGDINLMIRLTIGFTIDFDTTKGKFESELPVSSKNGKHIYGDGSCIFNIETNSGDVEVGGKLY